MADAKFTPAMTVRAEAMRLAIECGKAFKDASFADLTACAEQIEAWLYQAKAPAILRADKIPPPPPDWGSTTPIERHGHA